MAEARLCVNQEQLSCSICLELLNDPVTIPCGHSYCMDCIRHHWEANAYGRQYNCPLCRQRFTSKPILSKNVVIAEILEKIRRTELQPASQHAPVTHIEAGPGDVECDVCTGRKYKAIKSCLLCQISLCQSHFQKHEIAFKGESHCLIDDPEQLEEMICPNQWDAQGVGQGCSSSFNCRRESELSVQSRCTRTAMYTEKTNAPTSKPRIQPRVNLPPPVLSYSDQVRQCLTNDKKHEVTPGAERMFQDVAGISTARDPRSVNTSAVRKNATSCSSYSVPPKPFSFDVVCRADYARKSFSKRAAKKMGDFLNSEVVVVSGWVMRCKFPTDGPRNRSQILQYSHKLSMDSNTVNETLLLSGENRVATNTGNVQLYPEHPDRFDCWPQVLCKESVCGRAYWEFEWSGRAGVGVSLAYRSICRNGNGDESKFGCNDRSMNLYCSPSKYAFWDRNKKTKLQVNLSKVKTSRMAVYVDYSAGIVSFFSISDKMKLIYIVQTKFTQPIYPGFRVYCGSSVKLCDPAINCTQF